MSMPSHASLRHATPATGTSVLVGAAIVTAALGIAFWAYADSASRVEVQFSLPRGAGLAVDGTPLKPVRLGRITRDASRSRFGVRLAPGPHRVTVSGAAGTTRGHVIEVPADAEMLIFLLDGEELREVSGR